MGLQKAYYAIKIKSFTFYAEKSAHLQPQNKNILTFSADSSKHLCAEKIYLLTFSADLQTLCTPVTKDFLIPPHFYKGIQKHFYHPNFSPFTNCLQTKKKHLSLLLPIQRHFERINISLFSLYLQAKKKAPHFTWDFRSTWNTQNSRLLQIVYISSPFLKKNGIFQTLI